MVRGCTSLISTRAKAQACSTYRGWVRQTGWSHIGWTKCSVTRRHGGIFAVFRPGLFRMKRIPPFCGGALAAILRFFRTGQRPDPENENCTDRKEREQHDNIKVHGYFSFPSDQLRAAIRCSGRFPDGGCAVAHAGWADEIRLRGTLCTGHLWQSGSCAIPAPYRQGCAAAPSPDRPAPQFRPAPP